MNMKKQHALSKWRKRQDPVITQESLGEQLGVSRWWVNRLEVGERKPSFDIVKKIEQITGGDVTPKDFANSQEEAAE